MQQNKKTVRTTSGETEDKRGVTRVGLNSFYLKGLEVLGFLSFYHSFDREAVTSQETRGVEWVTLQGAFLAALLGTTFIFSFFTGSIMASTVAHVSIILLPQWRILGYLFN